MPLLARRAGEVLAAMSERRLLVVGDLMLDEYLFGQVSRISPEAPVPVVKVGRESHRAGGAGNVAANAAALAAPPLLVGVLGDDPAGLSLAAELDRLAIERFTVVAPGRPTTLKTRIIAHNQQVVRCDREDPRPLAARDEEAVVAALIGAMPRAHAIVISDYAKGCLTPRVLKECLTAASARGLPVVVDPTLAGLGGYQPVTVLTPNHHEAGLMSGVAGSDDEAVTRMGRRLLDLLDTRAVLITRGEAGMSLFERDGPTTRIPTVAREVYDVTGAGDTVSTVLALALAAGATMVEAAELSNHAAGVVVGKVGTASASREEILATF